MTTHSVVQLVLLLTALGVVAPPLGLLLASVLRGEIPRPLGFLRPVERFMLVAIGLRDRVEMNAVTFVRALLALHVVGVVVIVVLLRLQHVLPLNPAELGPVASGIAFNTAVSFVTNTNWQAYGGETTLSHLSQALGLCVQNFVSPAVGIAVLAALARGIVSSRSELLGNLWVDVVRAVTYVLLPLSFVFALVLVGQGVVQTWRGPVEVTPIEAQAESETLLMAVGPAASQVAIKQLGTNGGGFFNANSAHPLENPTPLSNFLQLLAILLLPTALCFTFGSMIADRRQGNALLAAMLAIFIPLCVASMWLEQAGTPALESAGAELRASVEQPGGNMEGKEMRIGVGGSSLWSVATTAASSGSVNSMHDSMTPLAGLIAMWLILLGEVVFGGVGSGLYGMIVMAIIAVFVCGLMIGRTPEFLGKRIEAFEMKMASLVILLPAAATLLAAGLACVHPSGVAAITNPGAHGFSEILYAYGSASNNNGSAFGGLTATSHFYAASTAVCMWIGRLGVIIPVVAMAGSLAKKGRVPPSPGTLETHTPLFVGVLVATVLLVGALTYVPALALGPVVEQLQMIAVGG